MKGQTPIFCPQEAAGEGIPILLLGNKMDMDEHREVSFKEAEKVAQVGLLTELGGGVVHVPRLIFWSAFHTGEQGDVLRGQRLHQQERDGVPDAPGQVSWRPKEFKGARRRADGLLCVCAEC